MTSDCYLGIDLGTTTVKAGVVDADGGLRALVLHDVTLDTPAPGQVEFDGDAYLALAFDAVREALRKSGVPAGAIKGIGISSQGQTFVVLDENDRPLRPAISWLDVRAEAEAGVLSETAERIGHRPINPVESGPKLLWLCRHEPELMRHVRRALVIPDYLIFRFTGRAVTDPGTAGSTGMYARRTGSWLTPLLSACGLGAEMMPEVRYSGEPAGHLTEDAARDLGLTPGIPVAVGANDQSVGAIGAGNVTPGCASITLGTALAIIVTSPTEADIPKAVGVGLHPARGLYTLLAYAKTSGIVLRWLRELCASSITYEQLFEEIAQVPIGSEGVSCIPHFTGTGTPSYDASVRGAFSGLTLSHRRAHLARALVESLTFTIRENLELLSSAPCGVTATRVWGGGARSDVWLQMIADATGHVVERVAVTEAAVLGAAELAMVAAGRFVSVADVSRRLYRSDRTFDPDAGVRPQYDAAFTRYNELYRALYGKSPSHV